MRIYIASVVVVLFALASTPSHAQAVQTWVSGVGDDANPCSRTAPCKTFAGAISKTAAGGEIGVLDPGGFGALTITKSISVVAKNVEGGVLVSGSPGITINAGATDTVYLSGLQIEGLGTGTTGINIVNAGKVYVSHTVIRGFTGYGVAVQSTGGVTALLKDVQITAANVGVYVHSSGGQNVAALDDCTLFGNPTALMADTGTSAVSVTGSLIFNPIAFSNGAQFVSSGNNGFKTTVTPTTTVPLQ